MGNVGQSPLACPFLVVLLAGGYAGGALAAIGAVPGLVESRALDAGAAPGRAAAASGVRVAHVPEPLAARCQAFAVHHLEIRTWPALALVAGGAVLRPRTAARAGAAAVVCGSALGPGTARRAARSRVAHHARGTRARHARAAAVGYRAAPVAAPLRCAAARIGYPAAATGLRRRAPPALQRSARVLHRAALRPLALARRQRAAALVRRAAAAAAHGRCARTAVEYRSTAVRYQPARARHPSARCRVARLRAARVRSAAPARNAAFAASAGHDPAAAIRSRAALRRQLRAAPGLARSGLHGAVGSRGVARVRSGRGLRGLRHAATRGRNQQHAQPQHRPAHRGLDPQPPQSKRPHRPAQRTSLAPGPVAGPRASCCLRKKATHEN